MGRIGVSNADSPQNLGRLMPQMSPDAPKREMEMNGHKIYMSDAQMAILNFGSRAVFCRCGRGFGKTTLHAFRLFSTVYSLPRSTGVFLGSSLKQLYTKTTPAVIKSLEQVLDVREGEHFFRGQPPRKLKWPSPLAKPRVWENAIAWWNGNLTLQISMEVTASANSLNLGYCQMDEVRYLPWKKVQEEVFPAIRGEMYDNPGWDRRTNPLYLGVFGTSDAAITVRQREWESVQDTVTPEVNAQIAEMLAELRVCPELQNVPAFISKLQRLRTQSRIFFNCSSVENIELLSEDYLRRLRLELPELIFRIQIMGQQIGVSRDGYYSTFDPDKHCYLPDGDDVTNTVYGKMQRKFKARTSGGTSFDYEAPDLQETASHADDCCLDADLSPTLPLRIAFDYGANFNCMVVGQVYEKPGGRELRIIKAMYVKNERKLPELVGDFCRYYDPHRCDCKDIIYYMDSTARQGASYTSGSDEFRSYNIVMKVLARHGWNVTMVDMKRPMLHEVKYNFMNEVFGGNTRLTVRINSEQCEYLIASMESATVQVGLHGPRKFKGLEKYKSEEGVAGRAEERTDFSDAGDTLIIGVSNYTDTGQTSVSPCSGVFFCLPEMI